MERRPGERALAAAGAHALSRRRRRRGQRCLRRRVSARPPPGGRRGAERAGPMGRRWGRAGAGTRGRGGTWERGWRAAPPARGGSGEAAGPSKGSGGAGTPVGICREMGGPSLGQEERKN